MISSLYFAVNVRRRARSGTSGSGRSVPPPPLIRPGSSIPVARTNVVTLLVISGKLSIPALGSLIVRGQVPQPRLAERGYRRNSSQHNGTHYERSCVGLATCDRLGRCAAPTYFRPSPNG